jgi:hypothetical protein
MSVVVARLSEVKLYARDFDRLDEVGKLMLAAGGV